MGNLFSCIAAIRFTSPRHFSEAPFPPTREPLLPPLPSTGSISYVKDHGLLTYAAYRIRHFESRCKGTTKSEGIERFR